MNNTIIYCTTPAHIIIKSSDNITIRSLRFDECGIPLIEGPFAALVIYSCSNIELVDSLFVCLYQQCGLALANAVGKNTLTNISSSHLLIVYNRTRSYSEMVITNYHHMGYYSYEYRAIVVVINPHYQVIKLFIIRLKLRLDKAMSISTYNSKGVNMVFVKEMELTAINVTESIIDIKIMHSNTTLDSPYANMILFQDSLFSNIISKHNLELGLIFEIEDIYGADLSTVSIINCRFDNINSSTAIRAYAKKAVPQAVLVVNIQNTSFSMFNDAIFVIGVESAKLLLIGPVIFTKIANRLAIIHLINSEIIMDNHITFLKNQAKYCIVLKYVTLIQQSKLDIIANNFSMVFYANNNRDKFSFLCLFQYEHWWIPGVKNSQPQDHQHEYSIVLQDNSINALSNKRFSTTNCDWMEESVFMHFDPFQINKQIVQYINNSMTAKPDVSNIACFCEDNKYYNCSIDEVGPVYPGQTFSLGILVRDDNSTDIVKMRVDKLKSLRACKGHNIKDFILLVPGTCTKIEYKSILYKEGNSCNVFLSGTLERYVIISNDALPSRLTSYDFEDVYRIKFSPCPLGFALNKILHVCQCDPILYPVILSTEGCNIDAQTILRPASSWIIGRAIAEHNHTYEVSLNCPFDYCLSHTSHLNLFKPDSQCQFNRTDVLCGRCKEGFSTVFGTSQCKQCSNYYLFLLLPFIIVGIAFIMFLFISNFTVVEGSINGLIFYANIVSININGSVFFPNYEPTKYVYVLTSFLNLDLGIEVCFYNGMDDYAKMWLQLIFPIYLIFIATLLIITSRYSTRIQRLTARRALPVLATLFLLSYTKILRTVSSVLFSYSTITSLPNKNTTLVWSVDTEIKLFETKFVVLFIVCLFLFLMLLPFNAVLIFTRTLSRFSFINHFKPLLDAYHGPFKDRFYYWTGLQLLLSAVFFGISALDRNTNMMISILILGVMECISGLHSPYKCNGNNYQELLLILNLQALFTASWYTTSNSIAVNTLVGIAITQFIILCICQMKPFKNFSFFTALFAKLKSKKWCSVLQPRPSRSENIMELQNKVPEIAFNYKEFQEPLIGHDNY